jgi:hypothetical protein
VIVLAVVRLAVWLAVLPARILLGLSGRARVRVICLAVLGVVGYGVAQDNDWLAGPANATPAPHTGRAAGARQGVGPAALADIPPRYLALYRQAARRHPGLPWALLAAIGKLESDHGRSTAPGVYAGVNRAGCCAGPMQFNVRNGPPSTWTTYGRGGNVYDPRDAIPAAARKLATDGATHPGGVRQAVLAYNNDRAYVDQVLTFARRYATGGGP